jgi:hypothetical protein
MPRLAKWGIGVFGVGAVELVYYLVKFEKAGVISGLFFVTIGVVLLIFGRNPKLTSKLGLGKKQTTPIQNESSNTTSPETIDSQPIDSSFYNSDPTNDFLSLSDMVNQTELPAIKAEISYTSKFGVRSIQTVQFIRLETDLYGHKYLYANSETEQEKRTFLIERIEKIVVDGKEYKPQILIDEIVQTTDDYKFQQLSKLHREELFIFNFVATLGGRYSKHDKFMVAGYFKNALGLDVTPEAILTEEVSTTDFRKSVATINKWESERRAILKAYLNALGAGTAGPIKRASIDTINGDAQGEAISFIVAPLD